MALRSITSRRAWFRRHPNPRTAPRPERRALRKVERFLETERWIGRVRSGGLPRTALLERWLVGLAVAVLAVAIALAMR